MSGIKNRLRKNLIYAVVASLLFIFCCTLLFTYPFSVIFSQKKLNNIDELNSQPKNSYVNLSVNNLYYTGFDFTKNNTVKGHYYYAFNNNGCTFFLLKAENDLAASPIITDKTLTGKICYNSDAITNLSASVAKQVNWTSEGIQKITSPYLVDETDTSIAKNIFLFVVILIIAILSFLSGAVRFAKYFHLKKLHKSRHKNQQS